MDEHVTVLDTEVEQRLAAIVSAQEECRQLVAGCEGEARLDAVIGSLGRLPRRRLPSDTSRARRRLRRQSTASQAAAAPLSSSAPAKPAPERALPEEVRRRFVQVKNRYYFPADGAIGRTAKGFGCASGSSIVMSRALGEVRGTVSWQLSWISRRDADNPSLGTERAKEGPPSRAELGDPPTRVDPLQHGCDECALQVGAHR